MTPESRRRLEAVALQILRERKSVRPISKSA